MAGGDGGPIKWHGSGIRGRWVGFQLWSSLPQFLADVKQFSVTPMSDFFHLDARETFQYTNEQDMDVIKLAKRLLSSTIASAFSF